MWGRGIVEFLMRVIGIFASDLYRLARIDLFENKVVCQVLWYVGIKDKKSIYENLTYLRHFTIQKFNGHYANTWRLRLRRGG